MAVDVAQSLLMLEEYRKRFFTDLAPVRAEFAGWLRQFFKTRKPTKRAEMLLCLVYEGGTNHPSWHFCWEPGPQTKCWIFRPAEPLPSLYTEEEVLALGLRSDDGPWLLMLAYHELTVDAWEEADGFSWLKPLYFGPTVFRTPDAPRLWRNTVKSMVEKRITGQLSIGNRVEVYPPSTDILPIDPVEIIQAVRSGEQAALVAWADALAEAGDSTSADLLRWVIHFRDHIIEGVREVSPSYGFAIISANQMTSWIIGDCDCDTTNENTRNLGRLLAGWNNFNPAVEWLFRNFGLLHIIVESRWAANGQPAERRVYNLAAEEHFAPFEPTIGVTYISTVPVDLGDI